MGFLGSIGLTPRNRSTATERSGIRAKGARAAKSKKGDRDGESWEFRGIAAGKRRCFSRLATAHAISTATAQRAPGSEQPRCRGGGQTGADLPRPGRGTPAAAAPLRRDLPRCRRPVGRRGGATAPWGAGLEVAAAPRGAVPLERSGERLSHGRGARSSEGTGPSSGCAPRLNERGSRRRGADPERPGARARHPRRKGPGKFWTRKEHRLDDRRRPFA